ncbi:hypothetical protein, partial [Ignavibacterium sp.]|uniref:hypothetical protein n=1 Tax=Ignavibacterium sp. TaxID=2651167 RepID=UPI00307FBA00
MSSKEILENLIHDFNFDNLETFLRSKSRTFKVFNESIDTDKDNFTDGIKFGEFTTNDTSPNELVVYCFKVNKPLTERSGKKAQYDLAKKILKQEIRYSAGIFIFYDDKLDFRFSLIYDIPLSATKRDWSNFRRFTYFVSKDQTNKTFLNQIGEGDFTSLESIKEAFSVEKVT